MTTVTLLALRNPNIAHLNFLEVSSFTDSYVQKNMWYTSSTHMFGGEIFWVNIPIPQDPGNSRKVKNLSSPGS